MAVFSKQSPLHDIRFGTDGWRALIAKEFTYANLNICLNGLAHYILEHYGTNKPLIIGHDVRFLADKFAEFACDVIRSWGIPVKYITEPIPTPTIAFAATQYDSCGALSFTASHNPPEYMGIKYIPEYGGPATVDITDAILLEIDKAAISFTARGSQTAAYEVINPREAYLNHLHKLINFSAIQKANQIKAQKIVYDPLHGCGINYTDSLLREAGFDLEVLHGNYDAGFGGSMPDPIESRLQELKYSVLSKQAIFGASNDGDADRFAFLDAHGNFYPANKSMAIILRYLLEVRAFRGVVARTVATTHLLDKIAGKFNLETIETAVGFKWLGDIMRKQDTVIAAEESGGLSILGHIPEKDGILAILLMAEVLAVSGKSLDELWADLQDWIGLSYFYKRLDLELGSEDDAREKFIKKFSELKQIASFNVIKKDSTEGIKLYLDNGSWILARPSGTEAMSRIYLESNNADDLQKMLDFIRHFSKLPD